MPDPWSNEFPASFDIGNPAGSHVHFDESGEKFYGPDGVTVLFELDTSTGDITMDGGTITGANFDGGSIDGATITGGTVRTSSGGTRLEMSSIDIDRLQAFYGGVLKGEVIADPGGIQLASADEGSYVQALNGAVAINATNTVDIEASNVIQLNAPSVNINGAAYVSPPNVKGGAISGTTDGSGQISFNHGLGTTPSSVIAITRLADNFLARAFSVGLSTATLQIKRTDGTLVVSVGVNFFWMAIA